MRFLVGSIIFFLVLFGLLIAGLATATPVLLTIGMAAMCVIGNPMLAVAVYRFFSGGAGWQLKLERSNGSKSTQSMQRTQPRRQQPQTELDRVLGSPD